MYDARNSIAVLIQRRNGLYQIWENGKVHSSAWCNHWLAETYYNETGVEPERHENCEEPDCYCIPCATG